MCQAGPAWLLAGRCCLGVLPAADPVALAHLSAAAPSAVHAAAAVAGTLHVFTYASGMQESAKPALSPSNSTLSLVIL